jgi:Nif-specific ferredoxin III
MTVPASYTKDGSEWTPEFIESVDPEKCLGCGRCYKVCGRDVFELVEKADLFEDDDDFDDDDGSMVMAVENDGNCIGCKACEKVCAKKAPVFEKAA